MRNLFANEVVAVDAGRAVSGVAGKARTLTVLSGRIWLTTEGALEDHWLSAGEQVTVEPHRLIVMEAGGGDSRIRNSAPGCGKIARPWHMLRGWVTRQFAAHGAPPCAGSKTAGCHAGGR